MKRDGQDTQQMSDSDVSQIEEYKKTRWNSVLHCVIKTLREARQHLQKKTHVCTKLHAMYSVMNGNIFLHKSTLPNMGKLLVT